MQQLPEDFRDLLCLLNEHEVKYLIVGGWALGVHGYVRATGDMDIVLKLSQKPAEYSLTLAIPIE